jgi:hypothetical protein
MLLEDGQIAFEHFSSEQRTQDENDVYRFSFYYF